MRVNLGCKNEKGRRAGSNLPALQKYVFLYWSCIEHVPTKGAAEGVVRQLQSYQINLNQGNVLAGQFE
jgi:hypothetical protein